MQRSAGFNDESRLKQMLRLEDINQKCEQTGLIHLTFSGLLLD